MALRDQENEGQGEPAEPRSLVCESFLGVNTATTRTGVDDRQCYWIDGFIPLSPRNLRTLYGIGSPLYTAGNGLTIVCYYFYNIGAIPYAIVFLSDGSAVQVNTSTGAVTTIFPAGTIVAPSITSLGISQWGQQYLIIVANQPNGYWIWSGSVLYGAGGLAPQVTLTNVGNAYATPPTVLATGGSGYGAIFVATVANGIVTGVQITNPGQGYLAGDSPTLTFTGGTVAGTSGALTAVLSHYAGGSSATASVSWQQQFGGFHITTAAIAIGGSGYSSLAVGSWSNTTLYAGGSSIGWYGAVPAISLTVSSGVVVGITIIFPPGNTTGFFSARFSSQLPTISIADTGYYAVSSVTINNGGSGYSPATTITASSGGTPAAQAIIAPILSGGVIIGTTINSGGVYGSNTAPTLTVNDTSTAAAGTVTLMPFGVQGSCVETYQGHVWVFNGDTFNFTAPGSLTNFATSAGGGSDESSVSYLKVAYTQAISTNGFLFLLGDTSMDYISGVSTSTPSGGSPTTTFTQNNCDPETGTPYPAAVTTLGQEILIANSTGVHISSGGEFVKRSEAMDGVYNTVANFNGQQLSAAKATIFGKRVWMVLAPIIDPVSGAQVNKLLMFRDDGKIWWASQQDVNLVFIAGQEIDSVYTAWGTDGTRIYQLFAQPSGNFSKLMQSKFWDTPLSYSHTKSVVNLFAIAQFFGIKNLSYGITIDSENNSTAPYAGSANTVTWTNASGVVVFWKNASSIVIPWLATGGLQILPPTSVGQWGVLIGMTLTTSCDDMSLISEMIQIGDVQYRGA